MYCLLVEPDTRLRKAVRAAVLASGERDLDAHSTLASAAKGLARRTPDALILSDSFGDAGLDFLRAQRQRLPAIRILVYAADGTRRRAIEAMADTFLEMPFSTADVGEALGAEIV